MIKNILIINQPLFNRGDESAHRALVRRLNQSFPNTKITVLWMLNKQEAIDEFEVIHPNNTYVNLVLPHNYMSVFFAKIAMQKGFVKVAINIHPVLQKIKKYYDCSDLILCAPGGICMGGFQDWMHLFYLEIARICHKPLAYYSRSFGPFPTDTPQNRYFKKKSLCMLHYFGFLSIRDNETKKIAANLNVPYVPSIDSAFLERPHVDLPKSLQIISKPYIVFVPNELRWHYAYKQFNQTQIDRFYLAIISRLQSKYPSHKIVMLPQTSTINMKGDYYYFLHLRNCCEQLHNIEVIPDIFNSDVQQTIIQGASLVIGARYHSIVFAINNAIPFIALNYEHKIAGLLEILNLQHYQVDISQAFSSVQQQNKVLKKVDYLLNSNIQCDLYEKQTEACQIAENCFRLFVQYVGTLS